jgi:hypothetical protein
MRIPDGVKMVRELERNGLSEDEAIYVAREFIATGATLPVARPIDVTDKLVKIVPGNGAPTSNTGYWMTMSEFNSLRADPANMANKLGLPSWQHADNYSIYQITPRPGALVYESKVASTIENGKPVTSGGATQTIVVNRDQFTLPVKVGTLSTK